MTTKLKEISAIFSPGSFFSPILMYGDTVRMNGNRMYGNVTLKFEDEPKLAFDGMDYAPTDFIWVLIIKFS